MIGGEFEFSVMTSFMPAQDTQRWPAECSLRGRPDLRHKESAHVEAICEAGRGASPQKKTLDCRRGRGGPVA